MKKSIINEIDVIKLYTIDKKSIKNISKELKTHSKNISNILKNNNIQIKYTFTQDHRNKLSGVNKKLSISKKGTKNTIISNYKNMANHLRYNVDYLWLMNFDDFEKIKFLNNAITRNRDYNFKTDLYKKYINFFYFDENFNTIYKKWLDNNKNNWLKPSLDHINPKIKNNEIFDDIKNLTFLTWFENRCKSNIDYNTWVKMKSNITFYLT